MEAQNTTNWQVYINDTSIIVRDIDDIAQSVYLILSTIQGTDPIRPNFGSLIYTYLDKPMIAVEPMIVWEVFDKVARFENRIRLTKVRVLNWTIDSKLIEINGVMIGSSDEVSFKIIF